MPFNRQSVVAHRQSRAFTLNELLVVMAIIVLLIGIGLPAFNALNGSKSTESASNQISAFLGSARASAIGVQEIRGVMFYIDPASGRVGMVQVRDSGNNLGDGVTYLDIVSGSDFILLPTGVGVQTVDSCVVTAGANPQRTDDGYIGYNTLVAAAAGSTVPTVTTNYGGVILFDAYGKIISIRYGFFGTNVDSTGVKTFTSMNSFLTTPAGDLSISGTAATTVQNCIVPNTSSQVGMVLYLNEAFTAQGFALTDPQINGGTYTAVIAPATQSEQAEETWIDNNANLLLINRYNGTLIKGD